MIGQLARPKVSATAGMEKAQWRVMSFSSVSERRGSTIRRNCSSRAWGGGCVRRRYHSSGTISNSYFIYSYIIVKQTMAAVATGNK